MAERKLFCVGGHAFALEADDGPARWAGLENYAPFEVTEEAFGPQPVFSLSVRRRDGRPEVSGAVPVVSFEGDGTRIGLYEEADGTLLFSFSALGQPAAADGLLRVCPGKAESELLLAASAGLRRKAFAVNSALLLLYAMHTACCDTLLIHASTVACRGRAYVFLGRSGTGKSTHSRLWLQQVEGARLLNDDNPVLRLEDGVVMVCGTPWSGKTPCYLNESLPLGAIVRLSRAPFNRIARLEGVAAYAALRPSASAMRWKREYADGLHRTLARLVACAPVYHLQCLPDGAAARLCHDTVTGEGRQP